MQSLWLVMKQIAPEATVYALDTFEGMPPTDKTVGAHSVGDFSDVLFDELQKTIVDLNISNLILVKGMFHDVFPVIDQHVTFGLAHIDGDIYSAIKYAQNAVWSRMTKGGYLVYDDADVSSCIGATETVEELIQERLVHAELVHAEKRLLEMEAEDPGQILLPTSDETAWFYAVNAATLRECFLVYQPEIATLRRILDKKLLAEAVAKAGLDVLPIWDPQNEEELSDLLDSLPYPILIKPRSHVRRRSTNKGLFVPSKSEMASRYSSYLLLEQSRVRPDPSLPGAGRTILQPFVSVGREGVNSITGFIDQTGKFFVTRHSTKVFQRSPPLESVRGLY
jgi:Macrocin-O-methyltransferase (TylF)